MNVIGATLSVGLTIPDDLTSADDIVELTVPASNTGAADATGVRLTSTFPANLSLFAVISGPGNLVFCCAQSYQRDIE